VILSLYVLLLVALLVKIRFRPPASVGLIFIVGTIVSHLARIH